MPTGCRGGKVCAVTEQGTLRTADKVITERNQVVTRHPPCDVQPTKEVLRFAAIIAAKYLSGTSNAKKFIMAEGVGFVPKITIF
jgi:hypothetical protein